MVICWNYKPLLKRSLLCTHSWKQFNFSWCLKTSQWIFSAKWSCQRLTLTVIQLEAIFFFFFFYNYVFLENTSVDNIHCSEISKCVKDYYSYTWTLRQAANTFLLCPLSVHSGSHFDSWKAFMQCLTLTIKIPSLQNAKLHQMLHLVFALLDFLIWLCSIYSLPTVLCGCYSRSLKQY